MKFEISVLDVLKHTVKKALPSTEDVEAAPNKLAGAAKDALPFTAGGAAVGAGTYATIGGLGLAGGFGAVGITLLPMIAIGGAVATVGYGLYQLGRQDQE